MEFGTYIVVNGRLMCFATEEEAKEWIALHINDED